MRAELDASALIGNFRAIQELAGGANGGQELLPMVKANAYGHGAEWAVRTLAGLPGLYGFGVATLAEGIEVRKAIGLRHRRTRVIVFSGTLPWSELAGQICEEHSLTPVISSDEDWRAFQKGGWPSKLAYHLKFNTGMNRLGIAPGQAGAIARTLRSLPAEQHPEGILSHLASAENPDSKLTRQQLECFRQIRGELAGAAPGAQFHLANSAAIWNAKHYGLLQADGGLTDIIRPGLSLYGVPPWNGAAARGTRPVMTLSAQVLAVHKLKPGESVGYGGRWVMTAEELQRSGGYVAILGAGYADGLVRTLTGSNEPSAAKGAPMPGGYAWIEGRETRFLGVVSMDMSAVAASARTRPGDWVEILGPHVDPWAQARAGHTIPYELLTSVAPRVQRVIL